MLKTGDYGLIKVGNYHHIVERMRPGRHSESPPNINAVEGQPEQKTKQEWADSKRVTQFPDVMDQAENDGGQQYGHGNPEPFSIEKILEEEDEQRNQYDPEKEFLVQTRSQR